MGDSISTRLLWLGALAAACTSRDGPVSETDAGSSSSAGTSTGASPTSGLSSGGEASTTSGTPTTSVGGTSSTGAGETEADVCPDEDGAVVLDIEATLFPGRQLVCGAVQLPADTAAGRRMWFSLLRPGFGGDVIDVGPTNDVPRVYFRVSVLPGTYLVGLSVDQNGDEVVNYGDYRGFHAGTLAAPLTYEAEATAIDVEETSRTDIDFGLGLYE